MNSKSLRIGIVMMVPIIIIGYLGCSAVDDSPSTKTTRRTTASPSQGIVDCGSPDCNYCVDNVDGTLSKFQPDKNKNHAIFRFDSQNTQTGGAADDFAMVGEHWQGIQRLQVDDQPYLVISRSGRSEDKDVAFIIVELSGQTGQTEGLNLQHSNNHGHVIYEMPFPSVKSAGTTSTFDHAGGLQLLGNILAVPYERSDHRGLSAHIVFYNVSDPNAPQELGSYALVSPERPERKLYNAGGVALTRLQDGQYLMVVLGHNSRELYVYQSGQSHSFSNGNVNFTPVATLRGTPDSDYFGVTDEIPKKIWFIDLPWWIRRTMGAAQVRVDFQALNFLTDCDSGHLYLVGMHNAQRVGLGGIFRYLRGRDFIWWFKLHADEDIEHVWASSFEEILEAGYYRQIYCDRCELDAAAGLYASAEHRVFLYSTQLRSTNGSVSFEEISGP